MNDISNLVHGFDLFGTIVFAVTGAVKGVQCKFDFLGVVVFACTVGCGGGMIRDSLIGATPAAALTNWIYLFLCIVVGIVIFFIDDLIKSDNKFLRYADAVGLGVFTALGTAKASLYGCSPIGQVLCGVITAIGGGVIRDLMSKNIPTILTSDIYATASLIGGFFYLFLASNNFSPYYCFFACSILVFVLRVFAMKHSLNLPKSPVYKRNKNK